MSWSTPSAFGQDQLFRGHEHFRPDVPIPPVGRNVSSNDLEEAHHRLNQILWRLQNVEMVDKNHLADLIGDLGEIENLIYRNLK